MHNKGLVHRDLKPDNLLLDNEFNLLVADFGFAAPVEGRDGSGYLRSYVGTKPYMAPEMHLGKPYKGEVVDIFAAAVILFIMVAGTPPFSLAKDDDGYYKTIISKKFELFWRYHIRGKPSGQYFFSEDFKNLMQHMLSNDPTERLSIQEIKEHPWYKGPVATKAEAYEECKVRR